MTKRKTALIKFKKNEDTEVSFPEKLSDTLLAKGKVKVEGVGIFEVKAVAAREGYSVNDKNRIVIPAHKKMSFRPTKSLRNKIQAYDGD